MTTTMATTMPAPMPNLNEDPAVLGAQQCRHNYLAQVTAIRASNVHDDISKAKAVVDVWQQANAALAAGQQDIEGRWRARATYLESLVPIGPGIDPSTSPADAAVLQVTFRSLLAEARGATEADLRHMLEDAAAFGDDMALRAGLTAYLERDGGRRKATKWWAGLTGQAELLTELSEMIEDRTMWLTRVRQTFAPIECPPETDTLAAAQSAAAAAQAAGMAGLQRGLPSISSGRMVSPSWQGGTR